MKKRNRIALVVVTLAIILSPLVCSCETEEEVEEPKKIGILFPDWEAQLAEDATRIKAFLEDDDYSCDLEFANDAGADEIAIVKEFAKDDIEVLVYCHTEDAVAAATVAAAKAADMKVICYQRLPSLTDATDCYVAVDDIKIGEAMGDYLVSALPAGTTGAPLFLYTGSTTDTSSALFFRGSWNVLQPKIAAGSFTVMNSAKATAYKDSATLTDAQIGEIIAETSTDWNAATAAAKAAVDVGTQTGTVYVLAPNDATSLAIRAEFAKTCSAVRITGQDGVTESIQAVIDGTQGMTILKRYDMIAKTAAKVAAIYADGEKPSADDLSTVDNGTVDVPFYGAELVYIGSADDVREAIEDGELNAEDFTGL